MTDDADGAWIRELTSEHRFAPASHPPLVVGAHELLGSTATMWAVGVGHRMAAQISDEVSELGSGVDDFETLRMGTEASALSAMLLIVSPDDAQPIVPEESLIGGREFARQGIPLDKMLRGIRLGHSCLATALLDAAMSVVPEADQASELKRTSRRLFDFIDAFSTQMTTEYLAEHDRWVSSAAAERAEIVRGLLTETPVVTDDASRKLAYPLHQHHLAMLVWQPANGERSNELQRVAASMLASARPTATLVVPRGANTVWVWAAWPAAPPARPPLDVPATVQVAVGSPGVGASGFRRSHPEAEQTAELARAASFEGVRAAVTWHADVELAVLLSGDLALARSFVMRELGPLALDTPAARELRETAEAYLAQERGLAQASTLLHVARNTVAYRVKKVEGALGHDLRTRRLELECALRLAATLGPRVLRQPSP